MIELLSYTSQDANEINGSRLNPKETLKKWLTNASECGKIIRHHSEGHGPERRVQDKLAHCKLNNAKRDKDPERFI